MSNPSIEDRLEKLEQSAHYHNTVERVDCNPEKAEVIRMKPEDIEKAKKKGNLHGDPVFVVE